MMPLWHIKLQVEVIPEDWLASDSRVKVSILRYLNPVGTQQSGLICENQNQTSNNLMPLITKVISW